MKPFPLSLPPILHQRAEEQHEQTQWSGIGNPALLHEPLLGLIASRECPGNILVNTLDRIPQWIKDNRIILSGFHSPLEQQVLHSLLRRQGRVIKLLARGITDYRAPAEERTALTTDRMLILTAYPPQIRRITRTTALERNRLILALATETTIPYVAQGSPLAGLLAE